jgi:hypothetical protein
MIKLVDILLESKLDTLARQMTSEVISLIKDLKKYSIDDPQEFEEDYKDYSGFIETSSDKIYNYSDKIKINSSTTVAVTTMKIFRKGEYNRPRSKKDIAKGYDITGSSSYTEVSLEVVITRKVFDNIEQYYNEIYNKTLIVARHELEHRLQQVQGHGREKDLNRDVDPSFSQRKRVFQYRLLPSEMEADAKAINLRKKKNRIPFEQAAREYYSMVGQLDKRDVDKLVSKMIDYAKKFNFK